MRRRWYEKSEPELLRTRLADLGLELAHTPIARRVERLKRELAAREIALQPHVWLSTSWFSPDGVPGLAVPFYLAHPRLLRMEEQHTGEAEGADGVSAMKLLRHEAGHALDSAFRLHASKSWRDTFGAFSARYRADYAPRPFRREFVLHLDAWYAQSHAAEDFAETFAVWLDPRSNWRVTYAAWPCIWKLEWIDARMHELAGRRAPVTNRETPWALDECEWTLAQYYAHKRARRERERAPKLDRELRARFAPRSEAAPSTAARRHVAELLRELDRTNRKLPFEERYVQREIVRTLALRGDRLGLAIDAGAPKARLKSLLSLGPTILESWKLGRQRHLR
ncbi:MAG: hypothetical protein IT453_17650 [Planctomycetes bacterium]|nr:hypothetical protein [Planctomycetota bacterium]